MFTPCVCFVFVYFVNSPNKVYNFLNFLFIRMCDLQHFYRIYNRYYGFSQIIVVGTYKVEVSLIYVSAKRIKKQQDNIQTML